MTPYENRLKLVTDALMSTKWLLTTRQAEELAAVVLNAVDTIPEKLR